MSILLIAWCVAVVLVIAIAWLERGAETPEAEAERQSRWDEVEEAAWEYLDTGERHARLRLERALEKLEEPVWDEVEWRSLREKRQ